MNETGASPLLSVVVIGRNEGERLVRCLSSIQAMRRPEGGTEIIYVDSDSSDGSREKAEQAGARVVALRAERPTPGLARNAGWRNSSAPFILFLDGDCSVHTDFLMRALPAFDDPSVGVVFGRVREIHRQSSFYDRVMELDRYNPPPGPAVYCAGNGLIRRSALEAVNGFDETLIACEEPEMSLRMRRLGWVICRIDVPMVAHELGMARLSQYCLRAVRMGYGFAEVSRSHRGSDLWDEDKARTNRIWGTILSVLSLASVAGLLALDTWLPLAVLFVITIVLVLRAASKIRWKASDGVTCLLYGIHWVLKQPPTLCGQILYFLDKSAGRRRTITYK